MAEAQSGQSGDAPVLPRRPGDGAAATGDPFAPPVPADSALAAGTVVPEPQDAGSGIVQDLVGIGFGLALVACAFLAFRLRTVRSELARLHSAHESAREEAARMDAEIGRLRAARALDAGVDVERLAEENRVLRRRHRAFRESRARLEARTDRDELTGLLVRRSFLVLLEKEIRRALRDRTPLSVIAWTMDDSELLNERLGGEAARRVLQRVSAAVQSACRRPGDTAGRIGPYAFAALLPGTALAGAARQGERVRESIRSLALPNPGSGTDGRVTTSVGLAEPDPSDGPDAHEILAALEAACLEAARLGGDQVVKVTIQPSASRRDAG